MSTRMSGEKCAGCRRDIHEGSALYHDRVIDESCVVRFYSHHACLQSGSTQKAADALMEKFKTESEGSS